MGSILEHVPTIWCRHDTVSQSHTQTHTHPNVNIHYTHIFVSIRDKLNLVTSSPLGEKDEKALLRVVGPTLWATDEEK